MAMKKELSATLDARQIRQACEQFVAAKMKDETLAFSATLPDGDALVITVEVTRKRIRKARDTKLHAAGTAQ